MSLPHKKQPADQYTKAKVELLRIITANVQSDVDRLPPEDELAKRLGVSRNVIRDVFGELESRGYITRKRGVGTIINTHVFGLQPRVDEQFDFMELIRMQGHQPKLHIVNEKWMADEEGIQDGNFRLQPGENMLMLERQFTGDGKPLVYNKVFIKESIFELDYSKWRGYEELTVFEFLELFCSKQATVTLAEFSIVCADEYLASQLEVEAGSPLLLMLDVSYTAGKEAILKAYSYMVPSVLPLKLVRRIV